MANTQMASRSHVLDLLSRTPAERRAMAASADLDALNWDATLEPLWLILRDAAGSAARQPLPRERNVA